MTPEVHLWRSVIVQALDDAFLAPTSAEKSLWRAQARSWFNTVPFRLVCEMADTTPRTVMREFDRREAAAHAGT